VRCGFCHRGGKIRTSQWAGERDDPEATRAKIKRGKIRTSQWVGESPTAGSPEDLLEFIKLFFPFQHVKKE